MSKYSSCSSGSIQWYNDCVSNTGAFCISNNKIYCQLKTNGGGKDNLCSGSLNSISDPSFTCSPINAAPYLQNGQFNQSSLQSFISNKGAAPSSGKSTSIAPSSTIQRSVTPSSAISSSGKPSPSKSSLSDQSSSKPNSSDQSSSKSSSRSQVSGTQTLAPKPSESIRVSVTVTCIISMTILSLFVSFV